mmetsp:Transcript_16710/g.24739  ORF Transcript_16710/g.24739 Transcript_16710/m.24739 type:complete len:180 (-) Transcript_16710:51-590(-)
MPCEEAYLFGYLGAAISLVLSTVGASYGTVRGGQLLAIAKAENSSLILRVAPLVIPGVVAIYGLIMAILIAGKLDDSSAVVDRVFGYKCFAAGIAVGGTALVSGLGLGKLFKGVSVSTKEGVESPSYGWKLVFVMVFIEALALYGLILGLVIVGSKVPTSDNGSIGVDSLMMNIGATPP